VALAEAGAADLADVSSPMDNLHHAWAEPDHVVVGETSVAVRALIDEPGRPAIRSELSGEVLRQSLQLPGELRRGSIGVARGAVIEAENDRKGADGSPHGFSPAVAVVISEDPDLRECPSQSPHSGNKYCVYT
jgi:hypothetical protein